MHLLLITSAVGAIMTTGQPFNLTRTLRNQITHDASKLFSKASFNRKLDFSGTRLQSTCSSPSSLPALTILPGPMLPPGMVGLSFQKNNLGKPQGLFNATNRNFILLLKALGATDLRLGGDPTDVSKWDITGINRSVSNYVTPADIDALAGFAKAANVSVIYGIRFIGNTVDLAVSEATYVKKKLGARLKAFEIGNEPNFYTQVSPSQFISGWLQFQAGISKASPSAKFSGPAFNPNTPNRIDFLTSFVMSTAPSLDLLTLHYYHSIPSSSNADLTDVLFRPDASSLNGLNVSMHLSRQFNIIGGVRVDECNPYALSTLSNNNFGTALWAIQYLLTLSSYGIEGANFHTNAQGTTPLHGSSIQFDVVTGQVIGIRPIFYGLFFFAKFGSGRILQLKKTNLNADIGVIENKAGGISIAIVNTDPSNQLVINVNIPSDRYKTFYGYLLTAPSVNSVSDITFAGSTIGIDGSWSPTAVDVLQICLGGSTGHVQVKVPPGSAYLVRSSPFAP